MGSVLMAPCLTPAAIPWGVTLALENCSHLSWSACGPGTGRVVGQSVRGVSLECKQRVRRRLSVGCGVGREEGLCTAG
jgi:hypothetical protein